MGEEEFQKTYFVSTLSEKPTDVMMSIINQVYDTVDYEPNLFMFESTILKAIKEHEYGKTWKDETRVNKVIEACYPYWKELGLSSGKQILSKEEFTLIETIVKNILTSENTGRYFRSKKETIFQLRIDFTYLDVDCKALLDMILIDHDKKIIQPIDIKTLSGYTTDFLKSLKVRRYDIQAAWYTQALEQRFPDYRILPFKFIVESTTNPGVPLVFTCTQDLLDIGRYGLPRNTVLGNLELESRQILHVKPEVKGFHQLIEDYKWYFVHGFEVDRQVYESDGELKISWNEVV